MCEGVVKDYFVVFPGASKMPPVMITAPSRRFSLGYYGAFQALYCWLYSGGIKDAPGYDYGAFQALLTR